MADQTPLAPAELIARLNALKNVDPVQKRNLEQQLVDMALNPKNPGFNDMQRSRARDLISQPQNPLSHTQESGIGNTIQGAVYGLGEGAITTKGARMLGFKDPGKPSTANSLARVAGNIGGMMLPMTAISGLAAGGGPPGIMTASVLAGLYGAGQALGSREEMEESKKAQRQMELNLNPQAQIPRELQATPGTSLPAVANVGGQALLSALSFGTSARAAEIMNTAAKARKVLPFAQRAKAILPAVGAGAAEGLGSYGLMMNDAIGRVPMSPDDIIETLGPAGAAMLAAGTIVPQAMQANAMRPSKAAMAVAAQGAAQHEAVTPPHTPLAEADLSPDFDSSVSADYHIPGIDPALLQKGVATKGAETLASVDPEAGMAVIDNARSNPSKLGRHIFFDGTNQWMLVNDIDPMDMNTAGTVNRAGTMLLQRITGNEPGAPPVVRQYRQGGLDKMQRLYQPDAEKPNLQRIPEGYNPAGFSRVDFTDPGGNVLSGFKAWENPSAAQDPNGIVYVRLDDGRVAKVPNNRISAINPEAHAPRRSDRIANPIEGLDIPMDQAGRMQSVEQLMKALSVSHPQGMKGLLELMPEMAPATSHPTDKRQLRLPF